MTTTTGGTTNRDKDPDRCQEWVGHGRMGLSQCVRKPTGPDGLCTQHRNAKVGDTRTRTQLSEPVLSAWSVLRRHWNHLEADTLQETATVGVRLDWSVGQGPVFPRAYYKGVVVWLWLSAKRTGNGGVEYDGRGYAFLKDGTPGAELLTPGWLQARHLPDGVRAQLDAALAEVHGSV